MKKVKIIQNTFIAGSPINSGEILTLDDATAHTLVANYKAEYYEDKSTPAAPSDIQPPDIMKGKPQKAERRK